MINCESLLALEKTKLKESSTKDKHFTSFYSKKYQPKLEDYFDYLSGSISSRISGSLASPLSNQNLLNKQSTQDNFLQAQMQRAELDADQNGEDKYTNDKNIQSESNKSGTQDFEFDPNNFTLEQRIAIKPNCFNPLVIPKQKGAMDKLSLKKVLEFKSAPKPFVFK
eukprot:CAMPEP_0168324048 /NCGR_PEP_ID=MMETSP0213-20121227/3848_1 /TAXON_ID=151035 /ORGANISM="Euplotes harpa, Strain FSP1.4" /LENGTH=166 /DNA_ID=CAMNT_0008326243 /DNA_START=31 /DNA_END=529 /DNA_ORIENTATION=-